MKEALDNLKSAGCKKVYIDGSFSTSKYHPKDFDGCWEEEGVDPYRLDPLLLNCTPNGREGQKVRYFGELFPASAVSGPSGKRYRDFFQEDRDGNKKGVICIDLEELK